HCHILLFLCHLLPPTSTLFPYTTLFRSSRRRCVCTRRRGSSGGVPCAVIASVTRTFLLIRWWRSARTCCIAIRRTGPSPRSSSRSEEHTSELQSHLNLVCRLLLEKKKTA